MKEKENDKELTYVLFGEEAAQVYKISLNMLLTLDYLDYKVEAYSDDVKAFVEEREKWDDFIEINESDYLILKEKLAKKASKEEDNTIKNKKSTLFNFFKKNKKK